MHTEFMNAVHTGVVSLSLTSVELRLERLEEMHFCIFSFVHLYGDEVGPPPLYSTAGAYAITTHLPFLTANVEPVIHEFGGSD
jgi:hypothetical protein